MFTEKTVFILGAGASWHYGYPTGENLVERVSIKAHDASVFFEQTKPTRYDLPKFIQESIKKEETTDSVQAIKALISRWNEARSQFDELHRRIKESNPPHIDYFLGHNQHLSDIGKMLISWVLLDCNTNSNGRRKNSNRSVEDERNFQKSDDWLRFIIDKLARDCREPDEILRNEVSFITFNYDMSLETRIYEGLKGLRSFEDLADEFLENIPIMHIYGNMPPSSQEPNSPMLFSGGEFIGEYEIKKRILDSAYDASKSLLTMFPDDKEKNIDLFSKAANAIEEAQNIYILGFGFDPNNCERIKMSEGCDLPKQTKGMKKIFMTNRDNINVINQRASEIFFGNSEELLLKPFATRSNGSCHISTKDVYQALAYDFGL